MKKFSYIEKGRKIEAETRREFVMEMSEAGFHCERYISEEEAHSPNPIYNFGWRIGNPVFAGVCGPMNNGGQMMYESWEVYRAMSQ